MSRFAAYKAYHLTEQLKRQRDKWPDDDDYKKVAKAVINTFNRYQAAEYNTAISRTRTAKQWIDFTSDPVSNELYPNLKWLPSRSANPREEHIPFYNLVLPKTDPFWLQNQPGNLWNCKCDWEETDDPTTSSRPQTICAKGLEGNPAETGEVFSDQCTYFKQAGRNRKERKKAEINIANKVRPLLEAELKKTLIDNKEAICNIDGENHTVMFIPKGIEEAAQSMQGTSSYWIKNEILKNIPEYIQKGQFVCRVKSDDTHNTNKATIRLKRNTDWFYYFKTILPDGSEAYINIGHYIDSHQDSSKAGRYYFYTITKKQPSY